MKVLNRKAADRAIKGYNSVYDIDAIIDDASVRAMSAGEMDRDFTYEDGDIRILFDCVKPTVYQYDEDGDIDQALEEAVYWIRIIEVDGNDVFYALYAGDTTTAMKMSEKEGVKFTVRLENVRRDTEEVGYCKPVIDEKFDELVDAVAFYESIDVLDEYDYLGRGDKRAQYLEKSLSAIADGDAVRTFLASETAGKYGADSYDVYEVKKGGERRFMSVEIEDGVITLREHIPTDDEDFEDVDRWETDREWDDRYLTDSEYEHLFDGVKVIDEK